MRAMDILLNHSQLRGQSATVSPLSSQLHIKSVVADQVSAFAESEDILKLQARQEALTMLDNLPVYSNQGQDSVEVLRRFRKEFGKA